MDEAKYDEMYQQKVIAHNLKATKEQIMDDLNGVMSPLQRRMMKELLAHLDELNDHIKNLDDEIDNFMKPEEKQASQAIQEVTGIGTTSAQAILSVIGTDMNRFPTDKHISSWAGPRQTHEKNKWLKNLRFSVILKKNGVFLYGRIIILDGIYRRC